MVDYSTTNNINLDEGTIEFWLTLKESLNSSAFDDSPNIFFHYNLEESEYLVFKVYDNDDLYFTTYDGFWGKSSQLNTRDDLIKINEPMHFALVYSKQMNRSSLYLNGFKIDSGKYDYTLSIAETFQIGNPNIIIDEFRILNQALSNAEILESYSGGIPFSSNNLYLDIKPEEGDIIKLDI